jgi:maltose O-acetyltransferase
MIVVIVPGITIGDGAIVGMGSVVNQDVPPLSIVGNQPTWLLIAQDSSHYETLD